MRELSTSTSTTKQLTLAFCPPCLAGLRILGVTGGGLVKTSLFMRLGRNWAEQEIRGTTVTIQTIPTSFPSL